MKEIKLNFSGYWRHVNRLRMPVESGIYCVYRGTYSDREEGIYLKQLLYIGEAEDIRDRLKNHEKLTEWLKFLRKGETLIYSFAPIEEDRGRALAAFIHQHRPCDNVAFKYFFPFEVTQIELSGQIAGLKNSFTVYKSIGPKREVDPQVPLATSL